MPEYNNKEDNIAGLNNTPGGVDDILDMTAIEELRKKYGVYDYEEPTAKTPIDTPINIDSGTTAASEIPKNQNRTEEKANPEPSLINPAQNTNAEEPAAAKKIQPPVSAEQTKTVRRENRYDAFPEFLHMPGFDPDKETSETGNTGSDLSDTAEPFKSAAETAVNVTNDSDISEDMPLNPSLSFENTQNSFDTSEVLYKTQNEPHKINVPDESIGLKGSDNSDDTTFSRKEKGKGGVIKKTVLTASILTIIVCIGILLNTYVIEPRRINQEDEKLSSLKDDNSILNNWSEIKNKYPGINFPSGMLPDYAGYYALNQDLAGWINIPGADIDLPVVQGKVVKSGEDEEYLRKTFYGNKSKYGCLFIDCNNKIKETDHNTIIYGHNMSYDDKMFGPLENYRKIEFFKSAPIIEFNSIYANHKWKIYAVFITNGTKSGDNNGYIFNYIFKNLSNEKFISYIKQLDKRTLYSTGVDIQPTDRILTLSTCCYDFDNARLVVVARMVREGENNYVDTSLAIKNENPRYPQAWYDAKKQKNPNLKADKWYPN